uniref:Glycine cleavage system protein H n=1 Tax=Desulfobacca acetoxidans TaxID=60893 RepID=A0A7V4G9B8_9BACT
MTNLTPEEKHYCIWMEAGVIDFKICDKDYDCDHCEFDQAMKEAAIQSLARQKGLAALSEKKRKKLRPLPAPKCRPLPLQKVTPTAGAGYQELLAAQKQVTVQPGKPKVCEVFGVTVPTFTYLHYGHTWALVEKNGLVRLGLDDFSQRLLGPADHFNLPRPGRKFSAAEAFCSLVRQGHKAPVLAPLNGVVEAVNPKVKENPRLVHDDPFGEGWLFIANPTNLKGDLENLLFGESNLAWIEHESMKLLGMLESAVGVTLPSGGTIIDDVFGHYPQLGWPRLVAEFLHSAASDD